MKRVEQCVNRARTRHDGEEVRYTTCYQNGCWDAVCILKCHVKDGRITAIESDDSINRNCGREDVGEEGFSQGMIQMRPCVQGHAWKRALDDPDRILYPMKRKGPKGTCSEFERISWDEALDTIAEKIKEVVDLYGPYSIYHLDSFWDKCFFPIAPYLKAGIGAWGENSAPAQATSEFRHLGYDVGTLFSGREYIGEVGFEAPDLFNSNLIVMWGMNPLVSWYGPVAYYIKLAREKGIPTILIDPRYTTSAEVLADQWIPIRPGTDLSMMLAVAYVLFEEDIFNHDYVEKNVEPIGFEKFRNYVMGGEDGEPKSPEWAEAICAVPTQTIREFARLYANSHPVHLQLQYSPSKRPLGEYVASMSMLLQAMTGNLDVAGGCETGICIWTPERMPVPEPDFGEKEGEYEAPVCLNHNKMSEAILLHKAFEDGEITEREYRMLIGCPPDSPTPNVQMLIGLNNFTNGMPDTNKVIEALKLTHFSWGWLFNKNQQTLDAYDIVLPEPVHMFESTDEYLLGQNRFMQGPGGMHNYFMYAQKVVDAPGEIRPIGWVWKEIAKRLGFVDEYCPRLKNVSWQDWDARVDDIYHEAYDKWLENSGDYIKAVGGKAEPWDDFLKCPVVRVPIDQPFHAFKDMHDMGLNPWSHTESGKIEFASSFFEKHDGRDTKFGGKMDSIPRWRPSYINEEPLDSFYNPKTAEYPLSLMSAISMFRQQSCNAENPMLNDCYEHAIWLCPADAKSRGISHGDAVRVFNELGEGIFIVYITSKIMPGTAAVYHGKWYKPSDVKSDLMPSGIDVGGSSNIFTSDVHYPHSVGVNYKHALVQVERLGALEGDLQ